MIDFDNLSDQEKQNARKEMVPRLLYSFLFLVIYTFLNTVVQIIVIVQMGFVFFTGHVNLGLRNLSNRLCNYIYQIIRYITFNESERPFPFGAMPEEKEAPSSPDYE
jgi:hypothetical protein